MRLKNCLMVMVGSSLAWASVGPLGAQEDPPPQVREVFRVGALGDETIFTEVTDVVARGNHLIVLDRREARLVEIDPWGESVRTIGRKGEGPGDFMMPMVAGVLHDGNLWVIDYGLLRITFFDPTGQVVRTESTQTRDVVPYAVLSDSTALGIARLHDAVSLVVLDLPHFSYDLTLDVLDWNNRDLTLDHPDGARWGRLNMREPFGDWELFGTFDDGGIWTVERPAPTDSDSMATVTVSRWGAEGNDLGTSSISLDKIAIPPEVVEETLANIAGSGFTAGHLRDNVFLPDYFTPVDAVASSESGELFLKHAGGDNRWLRYDPHQGLTGQLDFPEGFEPMLATGSRIAGRQIDEFGVHMLAVLEVSWNRPAPK